MNTDFFAKAAQLKRGDVFKVYDSSGCNYYPHVVVSVEASEGHLVKISSRSTHLRSDTEEGSLVNCVWSRQIWLAVYEREKLLSLVVDPEFSQRQAAFYLSQKKWFEQRIVETQAELEKLLDSHRKLEDLCKQTLIKTDEGAITKSFWDNVPNPTYTHNLVGPD